MPTLSPNQIIDLVQEPIKARTIGGKWDLKKGTVTLATANDASKDETITIAELEKRIIQAAAIILTESGGKTDAVCYNIDGADGKPTCSPTPPAGPRGIDRGVWQWNDKAWPKITDLQAFNPSSATEIAYRQTNGYKTFTPWSKTLGTERYAASLKTIRDTYNGSLGTVTQEYVGTPLDVATVENAFGSVFAWTDALGKFLSVLISPAFWLRVGIGATGVAILTASIIYLARNPIAAAARTITKG